jgi:hypothetical protein
MHHHRTDYDFDVISGPAIRLPAPPAPPAPPPAASSPRQQAGPGALPSTLLPVGAAEPREGT